MWADAFKPKSEVMQNIGVPGVPGVPPPHKASVYKGLAEIETRNTGNVLGVPGVLESVSGTPGTPWNTGNKCGDPVDQTPCKANEYKDLAICRTPGTPGTPQKRSNPENISRWPEAVAAQFPIPASQATTPVNTDTFMARLTLFVACGLSLDDAQAMAHRMMVRDSQLDERRLCLECLHLSGSVTARRCGQWRKTGMKGAPIPADLATILQRCPGFVHRLKIDR